MLVLSRRPEQSLVVGDEITITVLGIDGDRVRLGIDAPRRITVLRHEIYVQVKNANAAAAATQPPIRSISAALRDAGQTPAQAQIGAPNS